MEHEDYKVVYRRYASLFFLVGIDDDEVRRVRGFLKRRVGASNSFSTCTLFIHFLPTQNELAILEFIHCIVETLDRYFSNVCELDIMYNLETVRRCVWWAVWRCDPLAVTAGRCLVKMN